DVCSSDLHSRDGAAQPLAVRRAPADVHALGGRDGSGPVPANIAGGADGRGRDDAAVVSGRPWLPCSRTPRKGDSEMAETGPESGRGFGHRFSFISAGPVQTRPGHPVSSDTAPVRGRLPEWSGPCGPRP